MKTYKITISDLEIEFMSYEIAPIKNRMKDKRDTEVLFSFFSDIYSDIVEEFYYNYLLDSDYSKNKFEFSNRIRAYDTLEEMQTYEKYSLFTETMMTTDAEINVQLFAKELEDYFKKQKNIENIRKIKIVETNQ